MPNQSLLVFQLGPVQEFIAQARSTRDLWSGSYLLSWLTAHAAATVVETCGETALVFPHPDQPMLRAVRGDGSLDALRPTIPNRVLAVVPAEEVNRIAEAAETAIRGALNALATPCWEWLSCESKKIGEDIDLYRKRWCQQLKLFPQFTWHAVPLDGGWQKAFKDLMLAHAARRQTRDFACWLTDPEQTGSTKDVLSGREETIGSEKLWETIKEDAIFKDAGPFATPNLTKRLYPHCALRALLRLPEARYWYAIGKESTREIAEANRAGTTSAKDEKGEPVPGNPYIAILAMDGDKMGAHLNSLGSREELTAFSRALAIFATTHAHKIVADAKGQLIYAGGDDVLAMLPADGAIACARKLRDAFRQVVNGNLDVSCGIAVGHYKYPLQALVQEAHTAERRAKNERGRGTCELTLLKRSGETLHWGAKWTSQAWNLYQEFSDNTDGENAPLSGRFAHAIAALLAPYTLDDPKTAPKDAKFVEVIEKEYEHVLSRQTMDKTVHLEHALPFLKELNPETWSDFPRLFQVSDFINRPRGDR